MIFRYEFDANGRPAARPIEGAHAGLAVFLTEEASWTDYVDLLLDSLKEAKPGAVTGNAYAVTAGADVVTIEHLHRKGEASVTVPRAMYAQALMEWREFLAG